jgi:hypothetical protein
LKYRFEHYESKGALFEQVKSGMAEYRLDERLWGLFIELLEVVEVLFEGIDAMEITDKVFIREKAYDVSIGCLKKVLDLKDTA